MSSVTAVADGTAAAPRGSEESERVGLKRFWIAAFFLSPMLPLALYFHGNWYTFFHEWSLAMTAGILAFGFIMNQFLLGARPKYFDRLFGLDKILRFHTVIGVASALLIVAHVLLKSIYDFERNLQVLLGVAAANIFLAVIIVSLLVWSVTILVRLRPIAMLRAFSARVLRIQYQHLRAFHNLTALAAVLVTGHVVLASSTAEQPVRQLVMAAWFVVAMGLYAEHKFIRPFRIKRTPFTVTAVSEDGPNVWTVRMKPPAGREWKNRAGQFAYFSFFRGRAGRDEHPFTLSSPAVLAAPGGESSPAETPEIAFTAKALGDWTAQMNAIQPGDPVAVDGPYGLFSIDRVAVEQPLVFLAGGVGITPFLAMLRTLDQRAESRPVTLVWNVRHAADLFCANELDAIAQRLNGFHWTAVVSRDPDWSGPKGRLDPAYLAQASLPENALYYLCGPVPQMEAIIRALRARGVKPSRIRFENFAM